VVRSSRRLAGAASCAGTGPPGPGSVCSLMTASSHTIPLGKRHKIATSRIPRRSRVGRGIGLGSRRPGPIPGRFPRRVSGRWGWFRRRRQHSFGSLGERCEGELPVEDVVAGGGAGHRQPCAQAAAVVGRDVGRAQPGPESSGRSGQGSPEGAPAQVEAVRCRRWRVCLSTGWTRSGRGAPEPEDEPKAGPAPRGQCGGSGCQDWRQGRRHRGIRRQEADLVVMLARVDVQWQGDATLRTHEALPWRLREPDFQYNDQQVRDAKDREWALANGYRRRALGAKWVCTLCTFLASDRFVGGPDRA
jgi:hypothetical protein